MAALVNSTHGLDISIYDQIPSAIFTAAQGPRGLPSSPARRARIAPNRNRTAALTALIAAIAGLIRAVPEGADKLMCRTQRATSGSRPASAEPRGCRRLPGSARGVGERGSAPQQDDTAHQDEDQEQHEPDEVENQPERGDDTA